MAIELTDSKYLQNILDDIERAKQEVNPTITDKNICENIVDNMCITDLVSTYTSIHSTPGIYAEQIQVDAASNSYNAHVSIIGPGGDLLHEAGAGNPLKLTLLLELVGRHYTLLVDKSFTPGEMLGRNTLFQNKSFFDQDFKLEASHVEQPGTNTDTLRRTPISQHAISNEPIPPSVPRIVVPGNSVCKFERKPIIGRSEVRLDSVCDRITTVELTGVRAWHLGNVDHIRHGQKLAEDYIHSLRSPKNINVEVYIVRNRWRLAKERKGLQRSFYSMQWNCHRCRDRSTNTIHSHDESSDIKTIRRQRASKKTFCKATASARFYDDGSILVSINAKHNHFTDTSEIRDVYKRLQEDRDMYKDIIAAFRMGARDRYIHFVILSQIHVLFRHIVYCLCLRISFLLLQVVKL